MSHLLQINIPTRNRARLLDELLTSMAPRYAWFKVAVFDNASEDDTAEIAKRHLVEHYERTDTNRGPAYNQLRAASFVNGAQYVWVLGDDELIAPEGMVNIYDALAFTTDPDWVLLGCETKYGDGLARNYSNVSIWAWHVRSVNPEVLLHATCWSGNIFTPRAFHPGVAETTAAMGSIFPQFHALMCGLARINAGVHVCKKPTVLYRKTRPLPPDNEHPKNTDYHLWHCADRLNRLFQLDLPSNFFSHIMSRRLIKEPVRHWRYLLNIRNWKKILNRLRHL